MTTDSLLTLGPSCLVVQGGGQKATFAAGVLDKFMDEGFHPFSTHIGTSAGALNLASYITHQRGLSLDFILNYTTKERFFDLWKFVRGRQAMNLDWAFSLVGSGEFNLNVAHGIQRHRQGKQALACVTCADTFEDHYFPIFSENWLEILKATCAIPFLYQQRIEFAGKRWVDGCVSANIPVMEAVRRGYQDIVVIQTTPLHHQQGPLMSFSQQRTPQRLLTKWWQQLKTFDYEQVLNDVIRSSSRYAHRVGLSANHTELLEMLASHIDNSEQVLEYLECPMLGGHVQRIAPERPLHSRTLLSDKNDMLADYKHGKAVATLFLQQRGTI
ncbi:patatin-like phospholipase family protein [Aliagarivorans taiwanensis]|uniref:patatin-like phospholipase family protein n=1 Tax=Aliagarivorans taiwanensis TaxID=561966 RepID=UPI0004012EB0|nr:patatin family protein [Aliagarivorans taiwanensis]